jgi:glycosyltransferase involved in cell wall biosynthesis
MTDRRALVVSYHTPQPDRDSGSRRVFHFLELLQEMGWDVVVLAADGTGPAYDVRTLLQRGIAVYNGYVTSIEDLLADGLYDLALIAYWPNVERYLPRIRSVSPATRIIVDSVDLHFVRESRERLRPTAASMARGLTHAHGIRFAAELNSYASADGVLTVSQKEADLVNDLLWDTALAWPVPDFEGTAPTFDPFRRRRGLVCIGSFEHAPNVDALRHLCDDILPLVDRAVLARHPVWIVGNQLRHEMAGLARGLDNVHMVGWVPTVKPYLERARVSVVPLRYGAGTKRKLVQALASGTPTVSTTIGIEGLGLRHGEDVLVADDPADFAAGVTTLLRDSKLWSRLATSGRQHVMGTNGRDVARRRFAEAVDAVIARAPKRAAAFPRSLAQARMSHEEYERLVDQLHETLPAFVRPGSDVLVVSKGDERLARIDGCVAGHFPQDETGGWAGYHPRDSAAAVAHLEELRSRGANVLVFPRTSFWWLEHYQGLADHLEQNARLVHHDDDCQIFSLTMDPRHAASREHPRAQAPSLAPDEPHVSTNSNGSEGVRLIAFYLPQFHPIPENDAWWGRGFTEWRNVARAEPQFPGHYQPHVPADLGFYDLRLAETRRRQADLARSAGIHGFCYYHYWFHGKRLLHRPFDEVLASGEPDFPFALCWANDPWSRRWDGREDDLLQAQTYSAEDDLAHVRWLLPALSDARAITVGGKPLFLVYRASHLPDPARTCGLWRREVERAGLPGLHLVAVETAWELGWDATRVGFDAKVLFQPQFGWLIAHVAELEGGRLNVPGKDGLQVYDYDVAVRALDDLAPVDYRRYEAVFPGWDNTARVGDRAVVIHESTPSRYEAWLRATVVRARDQPVDHRIVFVNAWNEWAEGCHLEPDLRHGHAYLDATRQALHMAAPRADHSSRVSALYGSPAERVDVLR